VRERLGRGSGKPKGAAGAVTAMTASVLLPLAFTAIEALPAEGAAHADKPGPSPSATCAIKQCGPAFLRFPASNVSVVTTEGSSIAVDVLAHDCDSTLPDQKYRFNTSNPTSSKGVAVGTVTVNSDNELVFTPAQGFTGDATFSYWWVLQRGYEINPANGKRIHIKGSSFSATVTVDVRRARR
jgi:hypothetical protein